MRQSLWRRGSDPNETLVRIQQLESRIAKMDELGEDSILVRQVELGNAWIEANRRDTEAQIGVLHERLARIHGEDRRLPWQPDGSEDWKALCATGKPKEAAA